MTDWNLSIVIIVPAALQDKANRLSCALGHDVLPGNTFSVQISDSGEDVTHYGCRTSAKQEFADILEQAGSGNLPDIEWADFDLTTDDIAAVLGALIIDVRPADQVSGHFDDVLLSASLARVAT